MEGSKVPESVILNSPLYYRVFGELLLGNDYGLKIAQRLRKTQGTASQQLYALKARGLIKEGPRDKAQHFTIDWTACYRLRGAKSYHLGPAQAVEDSNVFLGLKESEEFEFLVITLFEKYVRQFYIHTYSLPPLPALPNIKGARIPNLSLIFSAAHTATIDMLQELASNPEFSAIRKTKLWTQVSRFKRKPRTIHSLSSGVVVETVRRFEGITLDFKKVD